MPFEGTTYAAGKPLLVTSTSIEPASAWETGERWVQALSTVPDLCGIILPLELRTSGSRRQELHGIEVLEWLRWSAPEPVRCVPVLALAWESLAQILTRRPNLLLTAPGTTFVRLPEAAERNWDVAERFVHAARADASARTLWAKPGEIEQTVIGSLSKAERVTHHDLANEFYAAWRLWKGYCHAVQPSRLSDEQGRIGKVEFAWQEKLEQAMRRPAYRQFQASRRDWEYPRYPPVEDADRIVRHHIKEGLPAGTRILLVDDDFDKGLAEVLLQILFRKEQFQRKLEDEWVYSEQTYKDSWARFVAVKDIAGAVCWLDHWHPELELREPKLLGDSDCQAWKGRWAQVLNLSRDRQVERTSVKDILEPIDDPGARPKPTQTILLLDLRLRGDPPGPIYATEQMKSVQLREAIKAKDPDFPVIMLTASRQAVNFAAVMAGAREVDGWLTKEAPDVPADEENSSRAVHYLLERLHLFACLRDWYRPEMNWQLKWKLDYARLYNSPHRDQCQKWVSEKATEIFDQWVRGERPQGTFYKAIESELGNPGEVPPAHRGLAVRLVARRVAVATLLHTAHWQEAMPTWDLAQWAAMVPARHLRPDEIRYPSEVVNFTEQLWFRSYLPDLVDSLLKEEYGWLLGWRWDQNADQIRTWVNQAATRQGVSA